MNTNSPKKTVPVRAIATAAVLSAIAFVLSFLAFQVPLSPEFARMDFSDFPALMAGFTLGPLWGVAVELIKNALQLINTATAGIGELANFLMGSAFVFSASLVYKKLRGKKGAAVWSCVVGSVSIAVAAGLLNYFVLLPAYEQFMPIEAIIESFGSLIPFIKTKLDVILFNCVPFNLLKGVLISVVSLLLYRYLMPVLEKRGGIYP